MKRTQLTVLFLCSFLIISLLSCKTEPVKQNPAEINIRIKGDPAKLNPIIYPSSASREIYQYMLVPMADYNPYSLELEPILIKEIPQGQLIEEGEYKGGVVYDLEFLAEAKWDDGSPVDGDDLLFTLKTVKCPEIEATNWRAFFKKLVDVQVYSENRKKVKVIFSEPYMLAREAIVTANLFPKHIYDSTGATDALSISGKMMDPSAKIDSAFVTNFNGAVHSRDIVEGAGPYKLTDWETDQYVVLEKKKNYWAAGSNNPYLQAFPNKLIFKIIPDETTAMTLMHDGEIDIISAVSGANFNDLKKSSADKFGFFNPQLTRFYYMSLNNADPILADAKIRKAIAHCADVDQMIEVLENGFGHRQNGIFHATKSYSDKSLKALSFDLALAKKELDEAGWADTNGNGTVDKVIEGKLTELDLDVLISNTSVLGKKVSLIMQQEAEKVGIKINLLTKSRAELGDAVKKGKYHMTPSAITSDPNDDDPFNKWHTDGPANYINYSNPAFDKLVEENRVELVASERNKRYKKMQEIMAADQPVVFLYSPKERIVASNKINAETSSKRPGYFANTFTSKALVASDN